MEESKVLLMVGVTCEDPEREREFNEWYDNVHLPEVCRAPGVKTASRYEIVERSEGYPTYLTLYELEANGGLEKYEAYRQEQSQGKAPRYTPGPPMKLIWRKAFRRVRGEQPSS